MRENLLIVFALFSAEVVAIAPIVAEKQDTLLPKYAEVIEAAMVDDKASFPDLMLLQTALAGYEILIEELAIRRPEVITIIDFSLPSDTERLWVVDLLNKKVLYRCLVSHGKNTGELLAENFSNIPGSNASSPGFYATGETYIGKHGLSLRLDGLEEGINDKARERAIVMHGADYVSTDYINKHGRLGRSFGCPAVPQALSRDIVETIKGGSCLFIYAPKASYWDRSHIIRRINL